MSQPESARSRRPDIDSILGSLKDFQRATVDHAFSRMYLDDDPTRRFLVADEVGLGKTMIARGVIARAIDHMWGKVPRIDVIYICSNADIAAQNIKRLHLGGTHEFSLASRITMLPVTLSDLGGEPPAGGSRVNVISFTPSTSFDLRTSGGTAEERVLLFHMLERAGWAEQHIPALNVMQGRMKARDAFRSYVERFIANKTVINPDIQDQFATVLKCAVHSGGADRGSLRDDFDELCQMFARSRKNVPRDQYKAQQRFIGRVRELLAQVCLAALQPDIIVLDEFQRFKSLLDDDTPASALARELFNYYDATSAARVLLLSATPYKMYTLATESEDDHYADFVRTVRFLQGDEQATTNFEGLLSEYRRATLQAVGGITDRLAEVRRAIESALRRVMVRTERLAASRDRDGMLRSVPPRPARLEAADVRAYAAAERLARVLGVDDPLELWKSAPYLFNFMDGYGLKTKMEQAVADPASNPASIAAIVDAAGSMLRFADIDAFEPVDFANHRLRTIAEDTIESGAWRLVWIPPSFPYYRLGYPFNDAAVRGFTKRLIFSAWHVVPKAIATLLSYEAERRMVRSFDRTARNNKQERKAMSGLLRFARDRDDSPSAMPVLAMLYPCFTLASACDPLDIARSILRSSDGELPTMDQCREEARRRIRGLLEGLPDTGAGPADERWYWAAPLLLDTVADAGSARGWFAQGDLGTLWRGAEGGDATNAPVGDDPDEEEIDVPDHVGWMAHVAEARRIVSSETVLGAMPHDLDEVLADFALGAPGVLVLRSLARVVGVEHCDLCARNAAAGAAWGFRTMFNRPEISALIRGLDGREPYWRRVLEYNGRGCLQAVLDEYLHYEYGASALQNHDAAIALDMLAGRLKSVMALRTAAVRADEIVIEPVGNSVSVRSHSMRTHYALRFGDAADAEKGLVRKEGVRDAFNSPFWPFVFASTSVGQEGLDFHPYCHAIVHWNIPGNPVDLEQREGRVHRYKGHAVRRNVAEAFGHSVLVAGTAADPWAELFDLARAGRPDAATDIVPYWVYPGPAAIERHMFVLPLSRDADRAARVVRLLAYYRMVVGQNRQEDLLSTLLDADPDRVDDLAENFRIDLSPP